MSTRLQDWIAYEIQPIDRFWSRIKTLRDFIENPDYHEWVDMVELVRDFGFACAQAKTAGWEGDFTWGPAVFWLPSEGQWEYAFAWKQHNNGTTYVVSKQKLPRLEGLSK